MSMNKKQTFTKHMASLCDDLVETIQKLNNPPNIFRVLFLCPLATQNEGRSVKGWRGSATSVTIADILRDLA